MLIDELWLEVVGTVKSCWLGSAEVCSYGLELAHLWWQVWVVSCNIGCLLCRYHSNVYFFWVAEA